MALRYYSSTAERTSLTALVTNVQTTMAVSAITGFPATKPYTIIIDQDTVNEEVVEVTGNTGLTLTIIRGVDGTSAVEHSNGATVNHGITARDLREPNTHVNTPVEHVNVVTSGTRPGSPSAGEIIFETDTELYYGWSGSAWAAIGGSGGIDIPATRVDAVMQTLDGSTWAEGMALSVSDTVPADTEGQVGDVVFVSGPSPGNVQGKVLQVVTAEYSTSTSTTSTSYVTTGLTATITPSSTTSKVYATATTGATALTANQGVEFSIFRGTAAGTKVGSEIQIKSSDSEINAGATAMALDSPATASAQIYTLSMKVTGGTGVAQRGGFNAVMVLMEVAA